MKRNLAILYGRSTAKDKVDGRQWYPKARAIVSEWSAHYGYSVDTIACIVAALSPQVDWERNLITADDILAERGVSVGGCLHRNIAKARTILWENKTATIGLQVAPTVSEAMRYYFPCGPKVNAFACNLAGSTSSVTVDGHAAQAALDDVNSRYRLAWTPYGIFADVYREVAQSYRLAPCDFQAIVWLTWKALYPRATKTRLIKSA